MRVLLDTNIIIHRENHRVSNHSIGQLFNWLDKIKYKKTIHPYSVNEIEKYNDAAAQENYKVKLESYNVIKTIKTPDSDFKSLLKEHTISQNDHIDNQLLYEVYSNRVHLLITEDKKMIEKARKIGLEDKVFSINQFITRVSAKYPDLVEYKALSVVKKYFGDIDINSGFFDSFKRDYIKFETWFAGKCDETAYVCNDDKNNIVGFLYLKTEDIGESYTDISPPFQNCKRLKIGTFKVESTGFRLGERFIKIIFDNAIRSEVDEIYVTMFSQKADVMALRDLLLRWGFYKYGEKTSLSGVEEVLVKKMKSYDSSITTKKNFPNVTYEKKKMILPILPIYHTRLIPDSKLTTELRENFLEKTPHSYALQKVYISYSFERVISPGDILLIYRMGDTANKRYSSVITTIGIVKNIEFGFNNKTDFLKHCQNRSVFTSEELDKIWEKNQDKILIVKFFYYKTLEKKVTLDYLWKNDIIPYHKGPRPFTIISDEEFNLILDKSDTTF